MVAKVWVVEVGNVVLDWELDVDVPVGCSKFWSGV